MRRQRYGALSNDDEPGDEPGEDRNTLPVVKSEGGEAAHSVALAVHRSPCIDRRAIVGRRPDD